MAIVNRTVRSLTIALGAIAAVLLCAIGVVASSKARLAADIDKLQPESLQTSKPDAARAVVEKAAKEAADAKKKAEDRADALQDENADLKEQVKKAVATSAEQGRKLAAAERDAADVRKQLDAVQQETGELKKQLDDSQAQLSELLAKQLHDPTPAAEAETPKPKAAHAGSNSNKNHKRGYYANRGAPSTAPSSPGNRSGGAWPRISDKSDDASDGSGQ